MEHEMTIILIKVRNNEPSDNRPSRLTTHRTTDPDPYKTTLVYSIRSFNSGQKKVEF